jgi:hypothetical protein
MEDQGANREGSELKLQGILVLVALAIGAAVNIGASYSYDVCEKLILWSAAFFFLTTFLVPFIPAKYVMVPWVLASGGWIFALRFTNDIGPNSHFEGVLLMGALLVFSVVLVIKTIVSTATLTAENPTDADSEL